MALVWENLQTEEEEVAEKARRESPVSTLGHAVQKDPATAYFHLTEIENSASAPGSVRP